MAHPIVPLGHDDAELLEPLLHASGLTVDGLADDHVRLLVLKESDRVSGCAAVELLGRDGLLRSVAVAPDRRGSGLGRALVDAAEVLARHEGIDMLYLLTETAEGFFEALGYRAVSRDRVPEAVRRSHQFAALCPSTAVVMARPISHTH